LRVGGIISKFLSRPGLIYDTTTAVTLSALREMGVGASETEIQDYQAECRALFHPSDKLTPGVRQLVLHPIIRVLKPKVIVETGCASGASASFLLAALEKNGGGTLVSIDLPGAVVPQTRFWGITEDRIGALVPGSLKPYWKLIVGDSRVHLPRVLGELDADIFIHDSLHTTTHQAFEYTTARALMRPGTLIASDDIRWNDSFHSFIKLHKLRAYASLSSKNFGLVVNRFDDYETTNGLFRYGRSRASPTGRSASRPSSSPRARCATAR
jgi:predicted O-methyltransferase YrrM